MGTHALFSEDVRFRDLALIVIDEQHRFGVQQRMALANKGEGVDTLAMTATPIPRTLMLAAYGDIDTSKLTDKPPGRQPVDTRAMPTDRLDNIAAGLRRAIGSGAQAFWVCPLIDESDVSELTAATARHAWLKQHFGDRVELVHGRMKPAEKDAAMQRFIDNEMAVLVATTVVEVGVDVPNASVMVIEHAERFGLAQLHQLRGRVGRGSRKSSCVLLYEPPLGETARARIDVLRNTDDGFVIAEEDLRLRGGGEALGTRQSGMPAFRLAQFPEHGDLLEIARTDARLALDRDPELKGPRSEALRTLLYLFERERGREDAAHGLTGRAIAMSCFVMLVLGADIIFIGFAYGQRGRVRRDAGPAGLRRLIAAERGQTLDGVRNMGQMLAGLAPRARRGGA